MNIKQLREGRGLTQVQLAAASGVKQGDISKWERGKASPNAKSLLRLAVGLERAIDDIVAGVDAEYERIMAARRAPEAAPPMMPASADDAAVTADELRRQVEAFLQLPDRFRRRAIQFPAVPRRPESSTAPTPAAPAVGDEKHGKRGRASDRVREKRAR